MEQTQWTNVCCNPFNKPRHKRTKLIPVLPWMCEKVPTLTLQNKICDSCRKKLAEMVKEFSQSGDEDTFQYQNLKYVNQGLSIICKSPVVKHKLQQQHYPREKLTKIKSAFIKSMVGSECDHYDSDESEMISQLKEKFHATTERSLKVQILRVLPMSWSIKKIQKEFKVSNYMARKAKSLMKSGEILSTPNPKAGHGLCEDLKVLVQKFYESDEMS